MKIALIVEGKTEKAFIPHLRSFLGERLPSGSMPKLDPLPYDGRIPTEGKLRRLVSNLLTGKDAADRVIALTDVYTGTSEFVDAADAKRKMNEWVGPAPRFHAHVAQYDFEAWLLPYWSTIQRLARHNRSRPGGSPEHVNHDKPPSRWIKEIFETGKCRDSYNKPRDANRILSENSLSVAVAECAELAAFVNTILNSCRGSSNV